MRLHTIDENTFQGILTHVHQDCLVMDHVEFIPDQGDPHELAGGLVVPRANVSFLQERIPV